MTFSLRHKDMLVVKLHERQVLAILETDKRQVQNSKRGSSIFNLYFLWFEIFLVLEVLF